MGLLTEKISQASRRAPENQTPTGNGGGEGLGGCGAGHVSLQGEGRVDSLFFLNTWLAENPDLQSFIRLRGFQTPFKIRACNPRRAKAGAPEGKQLFICNQ